MAGWSNCSASILPDATCRFDSDGYIADLWVKNEEKKHSIADELEMAFIPFPNPFEKGDIVTVAGRQYLGVVDTPKEWWDQFTEKAKSDRTITYCDTSLKVSFLTGTGGFVHMQIRSDGTLKIGTYEEAIPHIGEASFEVKAERKFASFNDAFQKAVTLAGTQFLVDMFSGSPFPEAPHIQEVQNSEEWMKMGGM